MKHYSTAEWKNYRQHILKRDRFTCRDCGRKEEDGVVLQVHHLEYAPGRLPWEYSSDVCVTLCKYCHAVEHNIIEPVVGWSCLAMNDLGSICGTCDDCGTAIRYVYLVTHEQSGFKEVGTDCCDRLTATTIASSHLKYFKKERDKLDRFMNSARWQKGIRDEIFLIYKRADVRIVTVRRGHKIRVIGKLGNRLFDTADEAKKAVFELIGNGKMETFIHKMRHV